MARYTHVNSNVNTKSPPMRAAGCCVANGTPQTPLQLAKDMQEGRDYSTGSYMPCAPPPLSRACSPTRPNVATTAVR